MARAKWIQRAFRTLSQARNAVAVAAVAGSLCSPLSQCAAGDVPALERLKERSADVRWREIRDQWMPPTQSAKPMAEELRIAPTDQPVPLFEWSSQTGVSATEKPAAGTGRPVDSLREPEAGNAAAVGVVGLKGGTGEGNVLPVAGGSEPPVKVATKAPFPGDFQLTPIPSPARVKIVPDPYGGEDRPLNSTSSVADTGMAQSGEGSGDSSKAAGVVSSSEGAGLIAPTFVAAQNDSMTVPPSPDEKDTVFRPITQIEPNYDYSPTGAKPGEYLCPQPSGLPESEQLSCPNLLPLAGHGTTDRNFAAMQFQWQASNVFHNPLYFQDKALERYGHTYIWPLQPFASMGKFGIELIGIPYQMCLHPVWNRDYALGYYRPGDVAPHLHYPFPINAKAAAAAAGVYTGLIFAIP